MRIKAFLLVVWFCVICVSAFSDVRESTADEVSEEEKTELMKKIEAHMQNDGIGKEPGGKKYTKGSYECWEIARDVQIGLWDSEHQFDTALVNLKYKEPDRNGEHWVLETAWKIGDKKVYLEANTNKLYKGADNLLKNYRRTTISELKIPQRLSRIQIVIDIPNRVYLTQDAPVTVTLYSRAGTESSLGYKEGNELKGQPFDVRIKRSDGTYVKFTGTAEDGYTKGTTDGKTGKWTKTVSPCPTTGPWSVEVGVATSPVPGSYKRTSMCIVDLGMVPSLAPGTALYAVGHTHELKASLVCAEYGNPISGATMTFTVIDGPHAGTTGSAVTNSMGEASWGYKGTKVGTDTIAAVCTSPMCASGMSTSAYDFRPDFPISNTVTAVWIEEPAPSYPPAGEDGWRVIMADGFEGAFPGQWTVRAKEGSIDAYWGTDNYRSYSGSNSAFCAKSGPDGVDPPENYPNNMASSMIFGPFDLSDANYAELKFYSWVKTGNSGDRFWVLASLDGMTFYGKYRYGDTGGWNSTFYDLSDVYILGNLCGKPEVWIAFYFVSDDSGTDEGVFVDDVALLKYAPDGDPLLNITANESDGPISVDQFENVAIRIGLDSSGMAGKKGDLWVCELTPDGALKCLDLKTVSLAPGFFPTYQGPLMSFGLIPILNLKDMAPGRHTFFFVVDEPMNGLLDADGLYYDLVVVYVTSP